MKMNVLLVENLFENEEAYLTAALERLRKQLTEQGIGIIRSESLTDADSVVNSNASIDCVLLTRTLDTTAQTTDKVIPLLDKLYERQPGVPVFLLSDRGKISKELSLDLMNKISEFAWILEDSAEFIAGRIITAINHYKQGILPPLVSELMKYYETYEYSWAVPGHQGGVGFTKTPSGRAYHDFFGANLFRTDLGVERSKLGSLLDHTGAFKDAEKNISRIFGSDMSYSGVVGTSGSNRSIMQACIREGARVIIDRNCHKSIEQGMILTGARPVYMIPTRNQYGIIGPVGKETMRRAVSQRLPENLQMQNDDTGPVYGVLTNCTYDGICYNAEEVEKIMDLPYLHFDEAWYGYARFNPIYDKYYAMRGNPADSKNRRQTIFATHSSHKMLNALSQGSYIHIRNGDYPLDAARFNQAYMMHTTTSPLYAIAASNDIAAQMMDGKCGNSLTQEMINEAVDFRQTLARLNALFASKGEWFFKPWNAEKIQGKLFEDIDAHALATDQSYWMLKHEDTWHGFKGLDDNWVMLDPVKVSILTPGVKSDGSIDNTGVPAALVNAWLVYHGIIPTRTTDFQIMFLFSMGVTKGKWGTLLETLLSFKSHYDANTSLDRVLPELGEKYGAIGLRDLGTEMFNFLKTRNLGAILNEAYETLPEQAMTPREAYQKLIESFTPARTLDIETVGLEELSDRITASAILPYPPGIPMIISGERFGKQDSAHIRYLSALEEWDNTFPGFEHETAGVQVKDGKYQVLVIREEA